MMDIDKLEAGRELDALVAEKVMGLRYCEPGLAIDVATGAEKTIPPTWMRFKEMDGHMPVYDPCDLPKYSTEIGAAWEVVEHVRRMHPARVWFELYAPRGDLPWTAVFFTRCLEWEDSMYEMGSDRIIPSSGKEAPLAICRAALKVVGVK